MSNTSWEANRFSASQEISRILWNPKLHYRSHTCPPPVLNRSQLDPIHTPTSSFFKVHLNITFPSIPGSPKWSPSFRFPHQNSVHASPLPYALHAPPISFSSILLPKKYWVRSTDQYNHDVEVNSYINLLKRKRNLLYIRNQFVQHCKHFQRRLWNPIS